MSGSLKIGDRVVGPEYPAFVIAEAGVNHNGDANTAIALVEAAARVGADAVKFQTWVTEKLVTREARMAAYQTQNVDGEMSQFDMLKRLELERDVFVHLKKHAEEAGILFFSTPDEEDSADFLFDIRVPAYKIGSGEVTNLPFLRHIARKGLPTILSTGMSTLEEVDRAVGAIECEGNDLLALLHCVSNYPSSPEESNLKAMDTMRDRYSCPIGFSDHTLGDHVAIAAVARGADLVEKHLTLDPGGDGPDHAASLTPDAFQAMVEAIRSVESAVGTGVKAPVSSEADAKLTVQKVIVTSKDIPEGKILEEDDLTLRRAPGGLAYSCWSKVKGRRTKRRIPELTIVTLDDLE